MTNFLVELLHTFRVADFFDIVIITVLIYGLLVWFRAAASRFVLLGMSILGAVYIIARFFHMYLSAVVLQAFFAISVIALVVIFQEELRRFFERISIWGTMGKRAAIASDYPAIETLTRALSNLAQRRVGALVVVAGEDPLGRHSEGGIELDGRLSEALLESIFDPNSPGHDGAVIIEKNRVTKFGCHLPLSSRIMETEQLGTRHSAALGLSERSDALCIVASEERGTISVAHGATLEELHDSSELHAALERYYLERFPKQRQRKWRDWVRENSHEKAVAILLSCGLWFVFVFQTGTLRRDFIVPIEYRNLATDWVIKEPKPKEATITLLGRARAFDLLDVRTLNITLDMSGIREGAQEIALSRNLVNRPSILSVVAVEPEKIALVASQLIPFNMPVKVQTHGSVANGLELVGIEVSPDSIPMKVLGKPPSGPLNVLTEPIALTEITETSVLTPKLIPPDAAQFADLKPPKVEVKIVVRKKVAGKKNN